MMHGQKNIKLYFTVATRQQTTLTLHLRTEPNSEFLTESTIFLH